MRAAFIVNDIATEVDGYTTTRLARAAAKTGHEVYYADLGDLRWGPDDILRARTLRAAAEADDDLTTFFERLKAAEPGLIELEELDAVMLRSDSVADLHERPWAVNVGVDFGCMLAERGVTVVNEPASLYRAGSKLYLEDFPSVVRPKSLISRDVEAIRAFVEETGPTVLKPLHGAKGRNVFMLDDHTEANLTQIVEAILEEGYVVAQAKIGQSEEGDIRLFMLDGEPLVSGDTYAAVRRVPQGTDPRANISTGAEPRPVELTEQHLEMAGHLRDRLRADGMFFVGIDIVGDKVIEINAESPGGFQSVERMTGIDFAPVVIEALEKRVAEA